MRKILLFLVLAITIQIIGNAQNIRFSVFANPCINWFSSEASRVKSEGVAFGYDAGLTMDKYFADNYAISTGLSIGTLGGQLKYSQDPISYSTPDETVIIAANTETVKYNLQFITLPIGLKFKTKEIGYFTYYAHLGLTTQININAKAISDGASPKLDNVNISEDISVFNMGYHIGAGAQYSLGGNTAVVLGVTLTNGFLDVTSNDNLKITTTSLAIRLGLLF